MNFFNLLIQFLNNLFKRKENKCNEEIKKEDKSTKDIIETTMIGTNLTKTVSEQKSYKCWVQTTDGKIVGNTHIEISVAGKTYVRDTDIDGVAELPIRLNKGDYEIHSVYKGVNDINSCEITNYIHVTLDKEETKKETTTTTTKKTTDNTTNSKKTTNKTKTVTYKPNSEGEFWNPRYLSNGEEKQSTNYYCAEVSIMQCFYELFGIDLSQRHIADIAGTTTDGTGHQGINRALEILQKEHNVKLSYSWKNFSQVGWDKLAQYCRDPSVAVIIHGGWAELGTWNFEAGHYYTMAMLNPSKKYGYEIYSLRGASLQKRSFDYLRASMNYISQPSICVITKN